MEEYYVCDNDHKTVMYLTPTCPQCRLNELENTQLVIEQNGDINEQ
jgi:hypothetical protein